jgi:hypothetical protein
MTYDDMAQVSYTKLAIFYECVLKKTLEVSKALQ